MINGTVIFLRRNWPLLLPCLICILLLHPLSASAASVTYQYDARHRLTGAAYDSGVTIGYTYDAAGNRLTEAITAPAAAASPSAEAAVTALNTTVDTNNTSGSAPAKSPSQLNSIENTSSGSTGSAALKAAGSQNGSKIVTANATEGAANKAAVPDTIVYEDAKDGNTTRWAVSDGPARAYINNVYAADRESRVIELTGNGLLNSFRLLKNDGTTWNDTDHKIIQWSMKYSDDFVVSVAAKTTSGLRYISFTPQEKDALGNGTDVFHGLGADSKDGQWHTYIIDLGYELHEAQPNATILSLLGFYVRGSGQVVDIETQKQVPANLDSNGNGIPDVQEMKAGTNPYRKH